MCAIQRINLAGVNPPLLPSQASQQKTSIANTNHSKNILSNYLQNLGRSNVYIASFGSGQAWETPAWAHENFAVRIPKDQVSLSPHTKNTIMAEATKHITGANKWPEIKTINAWMVSAETDKFMSIGGLAKVADDLPTSFNKHFSGISDDKMTIVTPLYTDNKNHKLQKNANGTYTYCPGKNEIQLQKLTDINVPVFDEWANQGEMVNRTVGVYTGTKNGSPYIMFDDPQIFNVNPNVKDKSAIEKNQNCAGCYVTNEHGYDENLRFAFFSKCVYELAKQLKTGETNPQETPLGAKAPNIMVLNDWHVGSVAPLLKYVAKAERDKGVISKKVKNYFNELPSIYIAHNLEYQGSIYKSDATEYIRTKVLGTLFGEYTRDIMKNSLNYHMLPNEDKNTLFKYKDLNPGMMGLSLCDRVVPVSTNYGEELLESSEFAKGMQNLLKSRDYYSTFTPITNGYAKNLVAPTSDNIQKWLERTADDLKTADGKSIPTDNLKLEAYTPNNIVSARKQNKKEVFRLLQSIISREQKYEARSKAGKEGGPANRKYMLYNPSGTDISDIKDPSKVPVMTFVGRVAGQKGMDTIFKKAILDFAKDFTDAQKQKSPNGKFKDWEVPVIIIGGTVAEQNCYKELQDLKEQLKKINPTFAKRMLLFKGYANTNMLAMGTDFFLIPSNFEPCGLIQMEVMAKGVLPIASATGGLVSTINDTHNGFLSTVFYDQRDKGDKNYGQIVYTGTNGKQVPPTNAQGFKEAMERALHTYFKLPNRLLKMQRTAMNKDFSWDAQGGALEKYISLMRTGTFEKENNSYFTKPDSTDKKAYSDEYLATL